MSRLRPPLLVGAGGFFAVALLAARDPHVSGSYGTCPFLAVTGLPCPGCGGLRAVSDLTRGDLAGALGSNALVVVMVGASIAAWVWWFAQAAGRGTVVGPRPTAAWGCAAMTVIIAFAVVRTLPMGAGLAP